MAKEDKKIDFESSLKELENIVAKLEDENINLEDSVKSFEKGVNLVGKIILTAFAASVALGGIGLVETVDAVWVGHADALA